MLTLGNKKMNKSDDIGNLAKALSDLQGEITDAFKGSTARSHSYADLEAVLKIARPLMNKHGLSISQMPESSDATGVTINNILMHTSNEWISSSMFMPLVKIMSRDGKEVINVAQQMGSAISYARRYCLTSILGYTQTDDDNDAESYTQEPQQRFPQAQQKPKQQAEKAPEKPKWVFTDELKSKLEELILLANYTNERVCERFNIKSLSELTEENYNKTVRVCNRTIDEKVK